MNLLIWLFVGVLALHLITMFIPRSETPDEPVLVRPTLSGEELQRWNELYQANCILYQRGFAGTTTITNWTWEQYAELTGLPQWEEMVSTAAIERFKEAQDEQER